VFQFLLRRAARRWLAALWFAAFSVLTMALLFLHSPIAPRAVLLFIFLPVLSSAVAGYLWGGAILDPTRTAGHGQCLLRGLGVTAGAFGIFLASFALAFPLAEHGWAFRQVGALFLTTAIFGLIMTGPIIAAAGVLAAVTLFALGRRLARPIPEP
jgi:hypothetical protein